MVDQPKLTVVIPVLDEAGQLPDLFADLGGQTGVDPEVIAVDGGSTDRSPGIIEESGARLVRSDPGRGRQMNRGAEAAGGEFLLFLHADSRIREHDLLRRAVRSLEQQMEAVGHRRVAGHFRIRFDRRREPHRWYYRFLEEKSALNRTHTFNGDQGLLIHREFFERLGGFDESLPFLEDQRLGGQIEKRGVWTTLPGVVETSARRFERGGFWKTYGLMVATMGALVVDSDELLEIIEKYYDGSAASGSYRPLEMLESMVVELLRMEPRRLAEVVASLGGLVRTNLWQLFFLADVLAGENTVALELFDEVVADSLDRRWVDLVAGVAVIAATGAVVSMGRVSDVVARLNASR